MRLFDTLLNNILLGEGSTFGSIKKGALRSMFNYPSDKPLPSGWACRAKNIPIGGIVTLNGVSRRMTPLLKRRIVFACNAETKFSHR